MSLTNDPLLSSQWYLYNTGQRGASGYDLNIAPIWGRYSGQGLVIAVNDDGMDLTHPDLSANLLTNLAYDSIRDTLGQGFEKPGSAAINEHGTVVGSIVGMVANNGIGGTGVAWGAKIVPALTSGNSAQLAKMFLANLSANVAVSVNSWGNDQAFAENFGASGSSDLQAWGGALARLANEGRGGLGSVIAVSGGNERINGHDVGLSNFTSNKFTIAVGAITHDGLVTKYSSPGASLLVTAPGGVRSQDDSAMDVGYGIASADVSGASGYNTGEGEAGNYSYQNEGTSYSQPMVAAITALMLEANPQLGFRDVQSILALTARQVDPGNASWVAQSGNAVNLGGLHFSRDHGYGLVDAAAAVRLAESWAGGSNTVANWSSVQGVSLTPSGIVPDNTGSIYAFEATASVTQNLVIERLEVDIGMSADFPKQLSAVLVSPSGTTHVLFDRPMTQALNNDYVPEGPENPWPDVFTMGLTAFMGESSAGTWTLRLKDSVSGDTAEFKSFTVRAWGKATDNHNQLVLTDAFTGTKLWTDTVGQGTLNAAAVSGATTLSLAAGAQNKLAQGSFVMGDTALFKNVYGGAGHDNLTGNALNNLIRGNGGNDTVDGGAGTDIFIASGAIKNYSISKTSAGHVLRNKSADGIDGTDSLTSIESIRFSDKTVNLTVQTKAANADQNKLTSLLELYVSFFNRVPDADGMSYWIDQIAAGQSISQIAEAFYGAGVAYSELTGFSATMSNADFIHVIYKNVLGRADGADAGGLKYWSDSLASGAASRGTLVTAILASAHTFKGDATWGWVADLLDNKNTVAKKFSIDMGLNYLTPEASITQGMALAKAVTSSDTSAAIALMGVSETDLLLV